MHIHTGRRPAATKTGVVGGGVCGGEDGGVVDQESAGEAMPPKRGRSRRADRGGVEAADESDEVTLCRGDFQFSLNKGADTKIELGFSMTLAGATPGIHPEGRRLGALRLGRRLETPKSQVWFLRITVELNPMMGFTAF